MIRGLDYIDHRLLRFFCVHFYLCTDWEAELDKFGFQLMYFLLFFKYIYILVVILSKEEGERKKVAFFFLLSPRCVWPMHTSCFIPHNQTPPYFLIQLQLAINLLLSVLSLSFTLCLIPFLFFSTLFLPAMRSVLWTEHCTRIHTQMCVFIYTQQKALSVSLYIVTFFSFDYSRPVWICVCLFSISCPSNGHCVHTLDVNPPVWNLAAHLHTSV